MTHLGYAFQVKTLTSKPSLSESGLRAFEAVADRWQLTVAERQRLLGLARSTYGRLRARPAQAALDATTLERISHVLGIYKALHVLFIDEKQADSWIDRPSVAFGDRPARERLTSGLLSDLIFIRHHLDVARGW
jgi:uncharacterized protein (DUF2384 family)